MPRRTTDTRGLYLAMDETERAIVKKLTDFTHEGSASAMLRQLIIREALHYRIPVPRKAFTRRTFTWNLGVTSMLQSPHALQGNAQAVTAMRPTTEQMLHMRHVLADDSVDQLRAFLAQQRLNH